MSAVIPKAKISNGKIKFSRLSYGLNYFHCIKDFFLDPAWLYSSILPNQNTIILAFALSLVCSLYLFNGKSFTNGAIPVANRPLTITVELKTS